MGHKAMTEKVIAKYVNEPGGNRKNWNIKTDDGRILLSKEPLSLFQAGR